MKNKNIHLIPTEKPSRLCLSNNSILTIIEEDNYTFSHIQSVNIYITNSEQIKEGDWCINTHRNKNEIFKNINLESTEFVKKIILTTNQDLIKDGVQAIDDEFLEWFVNNSSCEEVEVYKDKRLKIEQDFDFYEIIIPSREPKKDVNWKSDIINEVWDKDEAKQENTLEEAARNYKDLKLPDDLYDGFIAGAKWQAERMFSEEDILDAWELGAREGLPLTREKKEKLFNQFKKNNYEK